MQRPDFLDRAAHTLGALLHTSPPARRVTDNYVTAYLERHVHIGIVAAEGSNPKIGST